MAAYLRMLTFLAASRGKESREAMQRQAAFLTALSDEAKARLDRGEYPPYHLVNAARRAAGVSADAARNWLQAFLYWRAHSLPIVDRPDAEPGAAPDTAI